MKDYDIDLITKICNLRYKDKKSQKEISDLLKISQAKVSRLIKKAFELDIIKVSIIDKEYDLSNLESKLEKKFDLRRAIVVKRNKLSDDELKAIIGQKTASYLQNIISDGSDLTKEFSQKFNVNPHILLAPLFVDKKRIRDAILEDSNIRETVKGYIKK